MAINVTPVAGPKPVDGALNGASATGVAARARAIAKLTQGAQAPAQAATEAPKADLAQAVQAAQAPAAEAPAAAPEAQVAAESGQNTITESAPVAPAAPAKAEEPLSPQYAQLARIEKSIRADRVKMKAEQEAFKAEREAFKAEREAAAAGTYSKDQLAKNPLAVLEEAGLSHDQIAQMLLNANEPSSQQTAMITKLEAKIAQLEESIGKTQKTFDDAQTQGYQQAVNQIRADAVSLVKTDPNFETIAATGSVEDVVSLIEDTFKDGLGDEYPKGTLLSVEQAAQMVEAELVAEYEKLSKLKKFQKSMPASLQPAEKQPENSGTKPVQIKTLTNAGSSSRQLSAKERALLAFKGELK